jgi:hypothetical protein
LIEAVPFRHVRLMLKDMKVAPMPVDVVTNAALRTPVSDRLFASRHLPDAPKMASVGASNHLQVAQLTSADRRFATMRGLVMDYELLDNGWAENFTFASGVTYCVNGGFILESTTRIEPGAVVKYDRDSYIEIEGPIDCQTEIYRPAVFCSVDDDAIGEDLFPSATTFRRADMRGQR